MSPPAIDLVEMPDLELHVGDTVETDLRDYFQPSVCIPGYELWHVTSADSAAVAVSIARGEALVVVALEAADSVLVTVGPAEPASDLEFFVSVSASPLPRSARLLCEKRPYMLTPERRIGRSMAAALHAGLSPGGNGLAGSAGQ